MGSRSIIPFGPQHPVLPEPIHLDLVIEDEHVVEAIPSFGFIHRGLETLVDKKDFHQMVYVAERICGICSFKHGLGYCQAVEHIMELEIPERALFLRSIWGEFSRIHSHLLWLGLAADAIGFESLFMHSWRVREKILNIFEDTTGGRIIFGVSKIGGCVRDITDERLSAMLKEVADIEKSYDEISNVFKDDYSVKHRFCGVGVLTTEQAYELGAAGPMLRASNVSQDMRKRGYAAYDQLTFEPIVETDGDCYARAMVRVREIYQSLDLIRQAIRKMPTGVVDQKVRGFPAGERFERLEQPRGEVVYYVKGNGTKHLDRFRVRTPTFANLPPLVKMLEGCSLADVPTIILSIDPCISCTER